jgi:hypothetical protein
LTEGKRTAPEPHLNGAFQVRFMHLNGEGRSPPGGGGWENGETNLHPAFSRRSEGLDHKADMIRVSLLILAAVLTAALPGTARADPLLDGRVDPVVGAQGDPRAGAEERRERRVARRSAREFQDPGGQRADREAIVRDVSRGRPGRRVGVRSDGDDVVVIWEYPGGRIAEIVVDGRTGRIRGER